MGDKKAFYPVFKESAQNVSDPPFSHFVALLPVMDDQSLIEPKDYGLECSTLRLGKEIK